jgi:transposase InsO family protein
LVPWYEVAINLIRPWTLEVHGQEIKVYALTCIDLVSNLVELVRIENKSAAHVGMLFENTWVARYPKLECCVHDNGGEFIGADFIRILVVCGIKDVPTTVKNPQSNAICEPMLNLNRICYKQIILLILLLQLRYMPLDALC